MEDPAKKAAQNQLNIELNAEVAKGVYSNLAVISHSDAEFVVDFIQIFPGTNKAEVRSRVIISPPNMKRLLLAMQENVDKYELTNGEIMLAQKDVHLPPNFGGPVGFA
jgi:hypothetical protein